MHVFKLRRPIVWGGETITELPVIKELKAGDFRNIPADMVNTELIFAGKILGKEDAFIDEIYAVDWVIIKDYLLSLVVDGGGNSLEVGG